MRLSLNMVGDNETNFPHKPLLTNRQVENLRMAFANKSSTDINLLKTQLSEMVQSGGFLGRLLGPLTENRINFNKKCNQTVGLSVSIVSGLTAAASAADAELH